MADDHNSRSKRSAGTPLPTDGFGVTPVDPRPGDLQLKLPSVERLKATLAAAAQLTAEQRIEPRTHLEMIRRAAELAKEQALATLRASIADPHAFDRGVIVPQRYELVARPAPEALPEDVAAIAPQARDLTGPGAGTTKPAPPNEADLVNFDVHGPHVTAADVAADLNKAHATIAADPTHLRAARLQEVRAFAGELTDQHVHDLCTAMVAICDGMAQHIKINKTINAEAVRGELLGHVTTAQTQVLEIIRILKTQVPSKNLVVENPKIAAMMGECLSDILVTASNAAMDKAELTTPQRELYVDLSNIVLDGMFKKPKFHDHGGGNSGQSASR